MGSPNCGGPAGARQRLHQASVDPREALEHDRKGGSVLGANIVDILLKLLFWLHLMGLAAGLGGGIALGFVGPKLIAAEGPMLEEMWRFERFFGRVGSAGFGILIITGPLMLWLKFGGPDGLTWWFWAKMVFVAIALAGIVTHQWAGSRFHRGDRSAIPLMFVSGRAAGASMALAVLCAVFTFS